MWTKSIMLHGAVLLAFFSLGFCQTPGEGQGEMTAAQSEMAEMAAERSEMASEQGEMSGVQGVMSSAQVQMTATQGEMTAEQGQMSNTQRETTGKQGQIYGNQGQMPVEVGEQQEIEPPEIGEYGSQPGAGALTAAGTGAAGTGSAGTGAAGTGAAGTGSAGTGAAGTGTAGTGSAGTGAAETGAAGTGSAGTGAAGTGAVGSSAGQGQQHTGSSGATVPNFEAEYPNQRPQGSQGQYNSGTHSNTNGANTNTNTNTNTNAFTDANTNVNTNTNTNTNTNSNTNTNTNTKTNINTKAKTNTNLNTYSNANTKSTNPVEYEPQEYTARGPARATPGLQGAQSTPNYEYEAPEPLSPNRRPTEPSSQQRMYTMTGGRNLYQPSVPSPSKNVGYTNPYNQLTAISGSRDTNTQTAKSSIQNRRANQYAQHSQQTAQKPASPSSSTSSQTQQTLAAGKQTTAGQALRNAQIQTQILQQKSAAKFAHPGSKNTANAGTTVSSSLYGSQGTQQSQSGNNVALAGMNSMGLAVMKKLYERFQQIARENNYDFYKVQAAISRPVTTVVAPAVQTPRQQASGLKYGPTTTTTKIDYSAGSPQSAGKYHTYPSTSQTYAFKGQLQGGQLPTQTSGQSGSQSQTVTYVPTQAVTVSGSSPSQSISAGTSGRLRFQSQIPGTTQVQGQTSRATQTQGRKFGSTQVQGQKFVSTYAKGQTTGGNQVQGQTPGSTQAYGQTYGSTQVQGQTSGKSQVQTKSQKSQGQVQLTGTSSAQSTPNQVPSRGVTTPMGSNTPSVQPNSQQGQLSSPIQYPSYQGQSLQFGANTEYLTNLRDNVARMLALKLHELQRGQYQQRYGIKPIV